MVTFGDVLEPLAVFGGLAMVIWTSAKAKLEHRKLDMMAGRQQSSNQSSQAAPENNQFPQNNQFPLASGSKRDDALLAELRGLKQQISEMQSTSHQFDLAFDAALERMEQRIAFLETKSISVSAGAADAPTIVRNGQG